MSLSALIQKGGLARSVSPATPATSATAATEKAKSVPTVAVASASFDLDRFEERAAIMEIDGGLARDVAERLAAEAQGFSVAELRKRRVLH